MHLTHLPLDKMAAISQTTVSNAFSWKKRFVFRFVFHWSLFLVGPIDNKSAMVQIMVRIFGHCGQTPLISWYVFIINYEQIITPHKHCYMKKCKSNKSKLHQFMQESHPCQYLPHFKWPKSQVFPLTLPILSSNSYYQWSPYQFKGMGYLQQVLELMQMHPKERLRRVILTASWFI